MAIRRLPSVLSSYFGKDIPTFLSSYSGKDIPTFLIPYFSKGILTFYFDIININNIIFIIMLFYDKSQYLC